MTVKIGRRAYKKNYKYESTYFKRNKNHPNRLPLITDIGYANKGKETELLIEKIKMNFIEDNAIK